MIGVNSSSSDEDEVPALSVPVTWTDRLLAHAWCLFTIKLLRGKSDSVTVDDQRGRLTRLIDQQA